MANANCRVLAADVVQTAHGLNQTAQQNLRNSKYKEAALAAEKAERLLADKVQKSGRGDLKYEYDDSLSWEIVAYAALGDEKKSIAAIRKINKKPIGECSGQHSIVRCLWTSW